MSEPRRALYLGRFQILHKGHLSVLKYIDAQPDVDELVIGIGSTQYSRNNKSFEKPLILNPFTFEERKEYVEATVKNNLMKPYMIVGIMDQHNYARWAAYTLSITPKISYIYTNGRGEIDVFTKLGYECRNFPTPLHYNATLIRELMANEGPWERFIPDEAVVVIKNRGLDKIVRQLYDQHKDEVEQTHQNRIRLHEISYEDFLVAEGLKSEELKTNILGVKDVGNEVLR